MTIQFLIYKTKFKQNFTCICSNFDLSNIILILLQIEIQMVCK